MHIRVVSVVERVPQRLQKDSGHILFFIRYGTGSTTLILRRITMKVKKLRKTETQYYSVVSLVLTRKIRKGEKLHVKTKLNG